jgi:hypothetical protein
MFNYCLLSGRVITVPTLRFYAKDKPATEFTLEILMGDYRWGTIRVDCLGRLAVGAAKHLSIGDRIAVAGLISRTAHRQDDGTYKDELRLVASDLELLRRDSDIESELSDEDLLF